MTLTPRVRIDSTAASPFRVSSAGTDVDTAEFNSLIFDGNQQPLRFWGSGFVTVSGFTWNDWQTGKNIAETIGPGGFTTPTGTSAIFLTMWRDTSLHRVTTPAFGPAFVGVGGTGGGGLCGGTFSGVASNIGTSTNPTTPGPNIYSNYCIFRNYN